MAELPKQKKRVPIVGTTTTNYYGDKTHYLPVYRDDEGMVNVGLPEVTATPRNNLDLGVSVNKGRQAIFPYAAAIMGGAAVPAIMSTIGSAALPATLRAMRDAGAKYSGAKFTTPQLENAMLMSGQIGSTGGGAASVAIPAASTVPNGVVPGAVLGVGAATTLGGQMAQQGSRTASRYLTEVADSTETATPRDSTDTASATQTSQNDSINPSGNQQNSENPENKKGWQKFKDYFSKKSKKPKTSTEDKQPMSTFKKVGIGAAAGGATDVARVTIMNQDPTRDSQLLPAWLFDKVSYGLMSPEGRQIKAIDDQIKAVQSSQIINNKKQELNNLMNQTKATNPQQAQPAAPQTAPVKQDTATAKPANNQPNNDDIISKYNFAIE